MHEVSQRWALAMSVSAAIAGVVALILGAFFGPIPSTHVDATTLATSLFVRGVLSLVALAAAFLLAYMAGFRIEKQLGPSNADPSPAVASAPLVAMFTTPGPRRDAIYSGMLTLVAYWFFTTIYIAALGNTFGAMGISASTAGSFIFSRILLGLALAIAGAGAGGLGARNAAARRITQAAFTTVAPEIAPNPDTTASGDGA
ncbi:MAG TPA: hypothetical protein VFN78_00620 [Ktedonobacterales bacterium]|nr:hypothetical protein [Ktedonobacterales bacterium]